MLTFTNLENHNADDEEIQFIFQESSVGEFVIGGRLCSIDVNPDKQRVGDEYFKLYDGKNFRAADHVIRILFRGPYFDVHGGKPLFKLGSRERKNLITFLSSKCEEDGYEDCTNWQYAIILFNQEKGLPEEKTRKIIKEGEITPYPEYLPFNLEMPPYEHLTKKTSSKKKKK